MYLKVKVVTPIKIFVDVDQQLVVNNSVQFVYPQVLPGQSAGKLDSGVGHFHQSQYLSETKDILSGHLVSTTRPKTPISKR